VLSWSALFTQHFLYFLLYYFLTFYFLLSTLSLLSSSAEELRMVYDYFSQSGIARSLTISVLIALFSADSFYCTQRAAAWRQNSDPQAHHQTAVDYHLRRCLDDASREYARTLALDRPRELTAEEWTLVRRFAPRIYVTRSEFFPLKDFAVILHPTRRLIAYHFFWEDDIDFPEDNDPCDHELMWVRYSEDRTSLDRVWTYFHGRILDSGNESLQEARRHQMRPRVNVQWGKHGSMPAGWEDLKLLRDSSAPGSEPISLKVYNEETFRILSTRGRRLAEHPLGVRGGWPVRFSGAWTAFSDFSRLVEPLELLDRKRMALVSRWNSATINQHFLGYNFRPKTEWPSDEPNRASSNIPENSRIDFKLPPKSAFDAAMPRYPNVWFYLETSLAPSYEAAVKHLTHRLRQAMQLRESYGPFTNAEGCDFEVTLEHLQPWEDRRQRNLQHSHAFHMRYYYSALARQKLEVVNLNIEGRQRAFYRIGASAHYEVEHTNPNHADVEICPICGRTGEYAGLKGNLVEMAHDPIGLELLLTGKVRGQVVKFEDWEQREVGSIEKLREHFSIATRVIDGITGDRNTLRIGVIVISEK
jgi:hypothetical protein